MVKKDGYWIILPLIEREDGSQLVGVNMVSAKEMSWILSKGKGQAFLGLLRTVEEADVLPDGGVTKSDSDSSKKNLPACVKAIIG